MNAKNKCKELLQNFKPLRNLRFTTSKSDVSFAKQFKNKID